MPGIAQSLRLRGPAMTDIPAAVALMNAVSMAEQGVNQVDEGSLRREWAMPDFDPEQDARFAFAPDGTLVGYVELWHDTPAAPHVWGCVDPTYQGQGIGAALMDWAEGRAQARLNEAPEGAQVVLRSGANSRNERAVRLLKRRGYRLVRHFWRMVADLDPDQVPDLPDWPEGIAIRPYFPKIDDRFVYQVMQDSFRDHWGFIPKPFDLWRQWATSGDDFDPALWFLAVTLESGGNEIVGAALCRPGLPEDPAMGWIGSLGVLPAYRRQGVASALLRYAIGEFHRLGKARVGLTVDAENTTGATRLYERAGMRVVRQWDRYDKLLRDGVPPAPLHEE